MLCCQPGLDLQAAIFRKMMSVMLKPNRQKRKITNEISLMCQLYFLDHNRIELRADVHHFLMRKRPQQSIVLSILLSLYYSFWHSIYLLLLDIIYIILSVIYSIYIILSICWLINWLIIPSIHPSIHPSMSVHCPIYPSILHSPIYPSIHLFIFCISF